MLFAGVVFAAARAFGLAGKEQAEKVSQTLLFLVYCTCYPVSSSTMHKKSKIFYVAALALGLFVFAYVAVFGRALGQDENHLSILLHVPQAALGSHAVLLNTEQYLAKNATAFLKTIEEDGYVFLEQLGSGYVLGKDNNHYVSTSHAYSSHFLLFTTPVLIDDTAAQTSDNTYEVMELSDEQCMTDSDCDTPASYRLQSSCPYTSTCIDGACAVVCKMPRGNPDWVKITQAIADCEVVSVMQTHTRVVSVLLKDDRTLMAVEPRLDAILDLALQSEEKCGPVMMATE